MGAVTYPHAEVIEFLTEHFVPVKYNVKEPAPELKEALGRYRLLWAPVLVFLDHRGGELRRSTGFLAPNEFLAEARLGLGLQALARNKPDRALEWFQEAADRVPGTDLAPEALFWAASAAYRIGGIPAVIERWDDLRARYPDSTWAMKVNVVPDELRAQHARPGP